MNIIGMYERFGVYIKLIIRISIVMILGFVIMNESFYHEFFD
jgi:hypothetical protein